MAEDFLALLIYIHFPLCHTNLSYIKIVKHFNWMTMLFKQVKDCSTIVPLMIPWLGDSHIEVQEASAAVQKGFSTEKSRLGARNIFNLQRLAVIG